MEYEKLEQLKQSGKSTVELLREKDGERFFIRRLLKGQRAVYLTLRDNPHPFLPKLYEVTFSDDVTTVIEEYIEGQPPLAEELTEKQIFHIIAELCTVLDFLHGKGIIHRDIKPSNLLLARDGHIRLIDFDVARMPKENLEQDTKLLGTRGYAPPEQYGFSQTDERADIYALGVTFGQLLGERARKPRYRRIIQKCTELDPDRRYQSAGEVKRALMRERYGSGCCAAALIVLILAGVLLFGRLTGEDALRSGDDVSASGQTEGEIPVVLPAPGNPHWNGETGIGVWDNVPESGNGSGEVGYYYRVYRRDTATPPDPETDSWEQEGDMRGNGGIDEENGTYLVNLSLYLEEDGYYYFAVSADGDGINYADSPYVISDAFHYTGSSAPTLPAPTGLAWRMYETDEGREYYAVWDNLDDYADDDCFNVCVYDKDGNYVMNNVWEKYYIEERGCGGIRIRRQFLSDLDNEYRFTVEVYSSRPNEYKSFLMPGEIPEMYYSPWLERY